jgi:hypothetical protein
MAPIALICPSIELGRCWPTYGETVSRLQEHYGWLLARVLRGERPLRIELKPGSVERRSGESVQMIMATLILTNTGKRPICPFILGVLTPRDNGGRIEKGAVSRWDLETNQEVLPGEQVERGSSGCGHLRRSTESSSI